MLTTITNKVCCHIDQTEQEITDSALGVEACAGARHIQIGECHSNFASHMAFIIACKSQNCLHP